MEILRTISLYADSKDICLLLIGGQALNFYGLSRQTGDIDLIVKRQDRDWWSALLSKLNYKATQDDSNFAMFMPSELGYWPIDLMFVDEQTFTKLYAQSVDAQIGVANIKVVSARHLATLKIHALKHYQEHRYAKDFNDLLWLLRTGKAGLSREELLELCLKYASRTLFDRIETDWKNAGKAK